jgi:hypothetical protein
MIFWNTFSLTHSSHSCGINRKWIAEPFSKVLAVLAAGAALSAETLRAFQRLEQAARQRGWPVYQ